MEAVPKITGLQFPPKEAINSRVYAKALKDYIVSFYKEDPESYSLEIDELEQMRANVCNLRIDYEYCALMRKYFCQIRLLLSRFPLGESGLEVTFKWRDAYSRSIYEVDDVKYEQAAILYNIGCYHMHVGAGDRSSPEGMKIACTHFQCAAWAFEHIRTELPQSMEGDLSPLLMGFMNTIALAQAQECILEKSIADGRKPNIISKVARQVSIYMEKALNFLEKGKQSNAELNDVVGSSKYKGWGKYCELKQLYYTCVGQLYAGLHAEELQNMGQRVAYFKDSLKYLELAEKAAKNVSDDDKSIRECLTFTNDVVTGKLTAAMKENEFVFHEKVPDIDKCSDLGGASLVKGIQFSFTDPEICGTDIFKKLIPFAVHRESSMYSEEKAGMIREIVNVSQMKQDELDAFMSSLQLDELLLNDTTDSLPQELVNACADLNNRDAVKLLTEAMTKVTDSHLLLSQLLDQHKNMMEEVEELRMVTGESKSSKSPLSELRAEREKCVTALTTANESNMALHSAVSQHKPALTALSQPLSALTASLPSVHQAMQEAQGDSGVDGKAELVRLKNKVQEMEKQRADLLNQLRLSLEKDDITSSLIAAKGQKLEELFKENLKKHHPLLKIIDQNMKAQDNILKALSEANANFASTRKVAKQTSAARNKAIHDLVSAHESADNILAKAEDAAKFYDLLKTKVAKLLKQTEAEMTACKEKLNTQSGKFSGYPKYPKGGTPGVGPYSNHAYHSPIYPPQTSTNTYPSSNTGGPKLKDFLQAGGGFKSLSSTSATTTVTTSIYSNPSSSDASFSQGYSSSTSPYSGYTPSAPPPAPSPAPSLQGNYRSTTPVSYNQNTPSTEVVSKLSGGYTYPQNTYPPAPQSPYIPETQSQYTPGMQSGFAQSGASQTNYMNSVQPSNTSTAQSGYKPTGYPSSAQYPSTQASYAASSSAGYAAASQAGYPAASQAGYPAASQAGYPAASQAGYPAASQAGYPAASQAGYPAASQAGYPASSQAGYPAASSQAGYPAASSQSGYSAASSQAGYSAASSQAGYSAASSQAGYSAASSQAGYSAASSQAGYSAASSQAGYSAFSRDGYSAAPHSGYPVAIQAGYQSPYTPYIPSTQMGSTSSFAYTHTTQTACISMSQSQNTTGDNTVSKNENKAPQFTMTSSSSGFGPSVYAGYAPTTQAGYAPTAQAGYTLTTQAGYTLTTQAGYAPTAQAGYAPTTQAGYAPTTQAGYAPTTQAGYAPTTQAGYAPTTQAEYIPTAQAGYIPTAQAGYAPTAQAGYAPTAQAGYAPTAQAGYAPTAQAGYAPTTQAGYTPTTQAGYTPTTQAGYTLTTQAGYTPTTQAGYTPTTQAGYTPTTQAGYTPTTQAGYAPSTQAGYAPSTQAGYAPSTQAGYAPSTQAGYAPSTQAGYAPSTQAGYAPSTQAGYAPSTQAGYAPSTQAGYAPSTQAGYAPSTQAGYAPSTQAGYAPSTQAGYAPSTQAGYAPSTQAGYAPSTQAGYAPSTQAGYAPSTQAGYPSSTQAGYPSSTQAGYSPSTQAGYAPSTQAGYALTTQAGYALTTQAGYALTTQAGYAPTTQAGYAPTTQAGYAPTTQAGYAPTTQAGYAPTTQAGYAPTTQAGYAPTTQAGYAPTTQAGYALTTQAGYALTTQAGYALTTQAGYALTTQAGYALTTQAGYALTTQAGYALTTQAGYAPTTQAGYAPTTQAGYAPTTQAGYAPTTQAGYAPTAQMGYILPSQAGYTSTTQAGFMKTPQSGYSVPQSGYSAPQSGYSVPQSGYSVPQSGYSVPQSGYHVPLTATQTTSQVSYSTTVQSITSPITQVTTNTTTVDSSSKPISNLDLLSGVDLSGPTSKWIPLTPEVSKSDEPSVVTTAETLSSNGHAKELFNDDNPLNSKDLGVEVSSNGFDSEQLETTGVTNVDSASSVVDISSFVKQKSPIHSGRTSVVDPLDDAAKLASFVADTERLCKSVEGLDRKSLNGPTNLEGKWKEIKDSVDDRRKKSTVSIGRCYPLKNRFPDILPFDHSRVVLSDSKDDYINASHVNLSGDYSFPLVLSQAPTHQTAGDYWQMIWQVHSELVVCLHTLPEIKNASYWPDNKQSAEFGCITVSVQCTSEGAGGAWVQRLLHLTNSTNKSTTTTTRALIHLQFVNWPPGVGSMPSSPAPLLQMCAEAVSLQSQQRNRQRPVVVTCVPGIGRSGVTAVLLAFTSQLSQGASLSDLQSLCIDLCCDRRGGLQDKDYLKFLLSAALYAAQDVLMKRGILTNKATFEEGPREKSHMRHPSADLLTVNCDFNRLKTKLGLNDTQSISTEPSSVDKSTEPTPPPAVEDTPTPAEAPPTLAEASPTPAQALPSLYAGLPISATLAASLDPQQLKIEPASPGKGQKITKESFGKQSGGLNSSAANPEDPFSNLDPLWSLNKKE